VNWPSLYYRARGDHGRNDQLMRLIDEQFRRTPFYGSRRMAAWLAGQGFHVNRKLVSRLMKLMAICYNRERRRPCRPELIDSFRNSTPRVQRRGPPKRRLPISTSHSSGSVITVENHIKPFFSAISAVSAVNPYFTGERLPKSLLFLESASYLPVLIPTEHRRSEQNDQEDYHYRQNYKNSERINLIHATLNPFSQASQDTVERLSLG
jgi:HTH-like domain